MIGVLKQKQYQDTLEELDNMNREHFKNVAVRLSPEPDNEYDSNAIMFQVLITDEWKTIGYVVKEITSNVLSAIHNDSIISIELEWVDFLTCWKKTGTGYFASIMIKRKGEWAKHVVRACSTR